MAMNAGCHASHKHTHIEHLDNCEHLLHENYVTTYSNRMCLGVVHLCVGIVSLFLVLTIILYTALILVNNSKCIHSTLHQNTREKPKLSYNDITSDDDDKVVSCYYNVPDMDAQEHLLPTNINPHLCTHINVAFAHITNKEIFIDESLNKTLLEIVNLKKQNPKLKILLSVGGAGNNNGFSDMVVDHASRKIFIRSIKSVLRTYNIDGIDLDWEFPAVHNYMDKTGGRERQHFSQLLREIRMEYYREIRSYILTVATASPETIVNVSYDVDQINMYVDYVNIMTYDFHYYTKYTPFTGLNSPLYPRPTESLYLATLNINYTIEMYLNKGLDRNKIVVGIPTYGHTFTLVNVNNPSVGSPASGVGSLGALGFANYPDICVYLREYSNVVEVKYDEAARVPYMHRDKEWVSYEEPRSVMEKAAYIRDRGLRGAMIYSLNADDYAAVCHTDITTEGTDARFPLAHSVRNALLSTTLL